MVERLENCLEDRPGEIEVAVKMRPRYARTKRPRGALLQLGPALDLKLCRIGGSFGDSEIPPFFKFGANSDPLIRTDDKVWWVV
jgi:hypothetical protein